MEVMEAIRSRHSCRSYRSDPISDDQVDILIEALMRAPSAGNLQSRRFFLVTDEKVKAGLARAALGQEFLETAPLVLVACADLSIGGHYGHRGTELYCLQDVAASVENLMLAATALGLGTVWVGAFKEDQVSIALELPEHVRPITMVPIGYTDEPQLEPRKLNIDGMITWIR